MGKKYIDESWDFRTSDTKTYTHCYHAYPARMIPQVTSRIIDKYAQDAALLFDPYCGSGTSLVEANICGIDAIGTDINPLAGLIAKAKTEVIDLIKLDKYLERFNDLNFKIRFGLYRKNGIKPPEIHNIDFWFDKDIQEKLSIIRNYIWEIENGDIADFFKVAFSETVRECSWTRNSEFKLYRMTERQMKKFRPDVFEIMISKLARNRKGLKSFLDTRPIEAVSKIYNFNTIDEIPSDILNREGADIVVTSPPYGDSRTTVAYGQFSRLSSQWLGFENSNQVDNQLMGGRRKDEDITFKSNILNKTINQIKEIDKKRVKDVISFYADFESSINNVSKVIKKGGYACYVVGNRKVKGVIIPTDEITKDFFEANGFEHIETIIRNIPNKKMPLKNSPSNVVGILDSTMSNEFIVVMRKG
jgi:tRNA G10  N-methylase Trm11